MRWSGWRLAGSVGLAAWACSSALGQSGDQLSGQPPAKKDLLPEPARWRFAIEPSAWYVSPGGNLKMPGTASSGGGSKMDLSDLNVDSPRLSPFIEAHATYDRWRLTLSGFNIDVDDQTATPQDGGQIGSIVFGSADEIHATLGMSSVEGTVAYAVWPDLTGAGSDGRYRASLDLLGGLRGMDVSIRVSDATSLSSVDELFVEPIVGGKLTMSIDERWLVEVQTTFGGMTDGGTKHSFTWDIAAGFHWKFTQNLGLQVGYRNFLMDLQSGEDPGTFDFFGGLAGVYAGVVLRF